MPSTSKTRLAALACAAALCLSAQAFAGEGFGRPHTQTHLSANLTDPAAASDTAATGRGEIVWVSDSRSQIVSVNAGVSLPVGSAEYGLTDSNTAATAPVTLTITHIGSPNVVYTCSLHVAALEFKAPKPPATAYTERGDYLLAASQKSGAATGPAFGSCASFPASLASGDEVSVAVGSNTLKGTLK